MVFHAVEARASLEAAIAESTPGETSSKGASSEPPLRMLMVCVFPFLIGWVGMYCSDLLDENLFGGPL